MDNYKHLVFEGGGVKGIAYAGAINVLQQNGILANIESVAGTSAGAITAVLIALNYTAEQVEKAISELDFKSFEDGFNPLRLTTSYGLYKGEAFLSWMKQRIKQAGLDENVTFKGLNEAGKFKELRVFATDLYTKSIQEFSYKETPDTIVAEAARASMSIPLFFKSWQFSNKQPNDHIYVDGGVLYNFPFLTYLEPHTTLGFYLKNVSGKEEIDAFGHNHPLKYVRATFDTLLKAQNIAFEENLNEEKHTVVIDDEGVSATNFKLDDKTKKMLMTNGEMATKAFLENNKEIS